MSEESRFRQIPIQNSDRNPKTHHAIVFSAFTVTEARILEGAMILTRLLRSPCVLYYLTCHNGISG